MLFLKQGWQLLVVILSGGFSSCLFAANIQVDPLSIQLSTQKPIQSLTLSNFDNTPLNVQIKAFAWSQNQQGEDIYQPTADLLISPPIATIAAGGQQLVRMGLTKKLFPTAVEKAYRIYIQEIPHKQPAAEKQTLYMALRIGLPIFIEPLKAAKAELAWSSTRSATNEILLTAKNTGAAHLKLFQLKLQDTQKHHYQVDALHYILPGNSYTWTIPQKQKLSFPLHITALTDQGSLAATYIK